MEGIQQETGLNLSQALREYWINRSHKLSDELDHIKNKARLENSPTQWTKVQEIIDNISRETTLELKRKKSTIKIDQGPKVHINWKGKTPEKVQEDHHPQHHNPKEISTNSWKDITTL